MASLAYIKVKHLWKLWNFHLWKVFEVGWTKPWEHLALTLELSLVWTGNCTTWLQRCLPNVFFIWSYVWPLGTLWHLSSVIGNVLLFLPSAFPATQVWFLSQGFHPHLLFTLCLLFCHTGQEEPANTCSAIALHTDQNLHSFQSLNFQAWRQGAIALSAMFSIFPAHRLHCWSNFEGFSMAILSRSHA